MCLGEGGGEEGVGRKKGVEAREEERREGEGRGVCICST